MRKKWLIISNCQTMGIAQCLSIICADADIDANDYWQFAADGSTWGDRIANYDHVVISPEIQQLGILDFSGANHLTVLPPLRFRAFHPDIQNVFHEGQPVKTPLDDYHSTIVFASYQLGLDRKRTKSMFNDTLYEAIRYHALWEIEKKILLDTFDAHGFDIRPEFRKWVRQGSFMHSINHPKAHAIYDLSLKVARTIIGERARDAGIIPHDTLVTAPVYPVFPEISERLGAGPGSYFFKGPSYRVFDLDEFIDGSFTAYAQFDRSKLHGNSPHLAIALQTIEASL